MNRVLIWSLAATCALSAWALSSRPSANSASQSVGDIPPIALPAVGKSPTVSTTLVQTSRLSEWPKPEMDAAVRSPFASPSPLLPKALVEPAVVSTLPAPPPPACYRFWGRMSSPEGRTATFLIKSQEGTPVAIQVGTRLEDSWIVESISDNTIVVANATTQQRTTIFVPPAEAATPR